MPLPKEHSCTIKDIYNLPNGTRAELMDGQIYLMAPPNRRHQEIVHFLDRTIGNHIAEHQGHCKIYPAPFAVFLTKDDKTYLEPDITVVCDTEKLDDLGCKGAPDWVIEIVSPASRRMDYYNKLFLYRSNNVREYWIVDPIKEMIIVHFFESEDGPYMYTFQDKVRVNIYQNLDIDFSQLDV